MQPYNRVSARIIKELEAIVGAKNTLYDDEEKMKTYGRDEVTATDYASRPEVVIWPGNTAEVSEIVKLANRENIPLTPQGARSGLSGGGVPAHGGIVLSMERMNKILEIDRANMTATVEPGVITNDFSEAVQREGLYFAGYPMSSMTCFLGGNVAENAGGGRAIKYGVTGRYIIGLETVMPSGEVAMFGGKRLKDVTGYNMVQLMVGSEGTLGIFTKIMIRLIPLPGAKIDMMVLFDTLQSAVTAVPRIMTETGIIPTSVEFMDRLTLETSCLYLGEDLARYKDAGAFLVIEVDGHEEQHVLAQCMELGDLCMGIGALEAYIARTPKEQEKVWRLRKNAAEAFQAKSPRLAAEDIVVPVSAIPGIFPVLEKLSKKYDMLIPCFGHAGDGNLHANILKNPEHSEDHWFESLGKLLGELYSAVHELGGTISGEHGIGLKRKAYLPLVLSQTEIETMKSIKRALDPNNILNPGKIFDL